ncbi:hypothetical protein K7432_014942 [Basidiobolus ranarum]|uniref:Cyclin N-terminal domain-containing protein n=1 Tax=Basidiobolus ranarum TaxID=34480 RepID=A0ABR2WGT4_9FUNG
MPGAQLRLPIHCVPAKPSYKVKTPDCLATFFADVVYHMWSNDPYGASPAFHSFCSRLFQITQPSTSTLRIALNYIYRYKETAPLSLEVLGSEYYIAVVALILANKYHEDKCYSNRSWAQVSGLNVTQLSQMELAVLTTFGWNIKIDEDEFDAWSQFLDKYWSAVMEFRAKQVVIPEQGQDLNGGAKDCRHQSFVISNSSITTVS